jgi:uncharacterized protein
MGRFLIFVVLLLIVIWLVRRALRASNKKGGIAEKPPVQGELVSCARCGLNLPRTEARESQGVLYCSEEHARLGRG